MDRLIFRDVVTQEDISTVREIVTSTNFFRIDEIDIAVELVEEHMTTGAASGYHFIFAELAGEVAAYCCFGPVPCSLVSYDIYWIATRSGIQGKGIGTSLLSKAEEAITSLGGQSVFLETSSKDLYEPTRKFYLRNGYTVEAVLEDFYDAGDDKVILRKRL
ncbi:MAG: GNAT family N-acetyltransferase [Bacteroidales bacterium]|nr:GNAT family N-acetyltransferase [Bacteroidales bacterium]